MRVGVDDVVSDAGSARIRPPGFELHLPRTGGFIQSQYTARQRHDDVVIGVHVVAGFGSGSKAPLRDDARAQFLTCTVAIAFTGVGL